MDTTELIKMIRDNPKLIRDELASMSESERIKVLAAIKTIMEPPVKKTIDFMPAMLGKHLPMGGSKKKRVYSKRKKTRTLKRK